MVSSRVAEGSSDVVAAPGGGGIQLPQGTYEIAMRFEVPRAQVVDWKVVCTGVSVDGQVGETAEQYRARRLAELARDRDAERAKVAAATSFVVGAMAPRARVDAGHAHVVARVDPASVGAAVANSAVDDTLVLPAGDIGRGTLAANARVMTGGDGVCGLQVTADDPDVHAVFTVMRIRDLGAEDRMKTIAAREVAVKMRGQLSAQLVTRGADPEIRRAKVEAQAAAYAEQARRLESERARVEAEAIYAREAYLAFLAGKCNAQANHRDRATADTEAELTASYAVAQRRDQAALRTRATLRAQLLALGARERPPMPAPIAETPGPAPSSDATWSGGYWSWASNEWEWQPGAWIEADMVESGEIVIGADGARTYQTGVRDHRTPREHVRDHRDADGDSLPWRQTAWKPENRREPTTRDHRDEPARGQWTPKDSDKGAKVRDHRDDDKKKDDDDDKPRVRDHR